jgi:para-aminobenzoate synthetase/4-amino-4-deoxychorismate lyase
MFPCASITGAPKVSTTRIIAELEDSARGVYTGCIGYYSPGPVSEFNVAIRTVSIDRVAGVAEYGLGGGIVWDSDADSEYEECRIKASVLLRAIPEIDLFETILWEPESGYFLLEEHIDRMRESAEYFDFRFDPSDLRQRLGLLADSLAQTPHRVRVVLEKSGAAALEARPIDGTAGLAATRVRLAPRPVDSDNVLLYHKTTRREVYKQARRGLPDCDDVILWNELGEVTESTIANIVVRRGGRLVTPPVRCGLLAGTFRRHLLESGVVTESVIGVDELKAASEWFLVNSVRRWVPAELVYDAVPKSEAT